jgi:hypothetical protein
MMASTIEKRAMEAIWIRTYLHQAVMELTYTLL